ncbi:hypothetical protein HU200_059924 [Digitaria exilis]|uniref:Glutamate receptor n=1 Tax=Digitaria exilis TaxID=1010633 RepID=A0A835AB82_9POAL|nr:hypothetical protein HU200_059924 [Digitaria exilis]
MEKIIPCTVLVLLLVFAFGAAQNITARRAEEFHVGVILDLGSLVGKVSRTSISLAVKDFYSVHQNYSTKLTIHIRDSMGNDVKAASAAIELLENYKVQAILGPQKSSEAAFISKLGSIKQVPIVSFTATNPALTYDSMPYFVRATLSDSVQVNSIASLIKFYGWREVVMIYDGTDYGRGILPHLVDALQQIDAHVPYRSVIPLSATRENIKQELYKLMAMQTRVFIVHMSSSRASLLFTKAKEAGMMNKGFVWIITNGIANIIDSLNQSVIEAMNGVIGIRSHVPKSQELDTSFLVRWNRMYRQFNPNELPHNKPSIFGLWAYDTVWALAQAAEKVRVSGNSNRLQSCKNCTSLDSLAIYSNGPELLKEIVQNKFRGLSGNFDLTDRQLPVSALQIINLVGGSCRHIGFWTSENGLSRQPVIWPGESTEIPRGWEIPASGDKLRVGVPSSAYPQFAKTSKDPVTNTTRANVFEEAVKMLPYAMPYEYVLFGSTKDTSSGSYDDFVYQVHLKVYDIVIGDITIRYNRTFYADFTVPYTESGIAMVVPVRDSVNKNTWIFLKPLTPSMWFGSVVFFIYTGLVVLSLEFLGNNKNVRGPIPRTLGIMIFFSIFEERLVAEEIVERFLSRVVMIVWLCFLLVVTSSYTANLTSMLTVQQLQPTVNDIQELLKSGENVGYHRGSYVKGILEELGFDRSKIKAYDTPDEFHNALSGGSSNGGIAALLHEVPYIKLFLANHCKGYTMVGPIYKAAGFGYALAKGNPLLGDISKAMLNVTGGDTMIQIEKKWMGYQNDCQNVGPVTGSSSLTFANFRGLFILTGAASTSSLLIALIIYAYKKQNRSTNMQNNNEQVETNRTEEENNEPQEGNQGAVTEECIQSRGDGEEDGQVHEQSDRNPHTSPAACDRSSAVHRGEPSTVLQS